ncbi:MAG: AmmeMemoRadiSam system radical SAM enzyme [Raoultibacter sp.]|jgi:pyruvate formate lyase activating enzyme
MIAAAKKCSICPHECLLTEGGYGICGARRYEDGEIVNASYGQVTALSLDPIEKKPLACFYPGSSILSVGSYGCNLSCQFCQNYDIAQPQNIDKIHTHFIEPDSLVEYAVLERQRGNIGLAFTYNEPFVSWEFMRDCARLNHASGQLNVAVTNGYVLPAVWEKSLDLIDAFNIDLKSFSDEGYKKVGAPHGFSVVKDNILAAHAAGVHLELTTLVVPGLSDDEDMFVRECDWISSIDENIPLHITRFFPSFKLNDTQPTSRTLLNRFRGIAEKRLSRVFVGNV